MLIYGSDKYKTQKVFDEAVDDCLEALKFIPDCFVTSKMNKKLFAAFYADDGSLFFGSSNVTFCCNEMGFLRVNSSVNISLNNIYHDNNFDDVDPDTIILVRLLVWHSIFKKRKALKKR